VLASRIGAVLLIATLATAAVMLTLARQADYRATATATAVERGALRPRITPLYLRRRLAEGRAELATRVERAGIDPALLQSVRIRPASRPARAVSISVAAATPERARRLLRMVVLQIDAVSAAELERLARRRLRVAAAALAAPGLDPVEEQALALEARGLRRYLIRARSRFGVLSRRVERPERWADRFARSLPGAFPARPSPIWAGLVGGLAGTALAAAAGLLRRRRRIA
jgi:hypothetical protein